MTHEAIQFLKACSDSYDEPEFQKALSSELTDHLGVLQRIVSDVRDWMALDLTRLPQANLGSLGTRARALSTTFSNLKNELAQHTGAQRVSKMVGEMISRHQEMLQDIGPWVAYMQLQTQAPNLGQTVQRAEDAVKKVGGILESAEKSKKRIQAVERDMTIAAFAKKFGNEAILHAVLAGLWVVLMGVCLWIGYNKTGEVIDLLARDSTSADAGSPDLAFRGIARITIVATIYLILFWLARNFRTSMHLFAVNRHRAQALSTFNIFFDTSNDQQVKDTVLLETSRMIFSHTATGYLGGKENVPGSLTDVVKSVVNVEK